MIEQAEWAEPTPMPEGPGSTRAMFDRHYAGALADEAAERRAAVPSVSTGAGVLRVDPAAYRSAIEKLTRAVEELEAGQLRWSQARSTAAIGIDPVSIQLRKNMDEMQRRAIEYVRIWSEQVRETRDALKAQLASYAAAERLNSERMV